SGWPLPSGLRRNPMLRRSHAEPMVRATELLLQERIPQEIPLTEPPHDEPTLPPSAPDTLYWMSRRLTTPHTAHPRTHLLSSGQYTVMLTNAGSGRSMGRGLDVTRWREDRTCDSWGQFCYLRDLRTGRLWSAGYQPLGREPQEYEVIFATDKAEFRRLDGGIETHLEIVVSPENHADIRRLTLTNHNPRTHDLEVTSYLEVVLGPHAADLAHPAFGKLFLETEFIPTEEALLCRRRPRAVNEKPVWALHVLAVDGPTLAAAQYATRPARFPGRGTTAGHPGGAGPPPARRVFVPPTRAGQCAPDGNNGARARPHPQFAAPGADRARKVRQPRLHDRAGRHPRGSPGLG